MNIAILCVLVLVATYVSWLYLSNRRPTVATNEQECLEDLSEERQSERLEKNEKQPTLLKREVFLKKPTGKQWIFLLAMFISLCGMSVALTVIYYNNTLLHNLKLICLLSILFNAAYVDANERIIPNKLVLVGLLLRVVFWVSELFVTPDLFLAVIKDNLLACLLVIVFLVIGVFLIKGGLGMGDIKLMLVMCLFQGFYGVVSALFSALFISFIYAIVILIMRKKTRKDSVAFAPAILLGTLLSVFLTGM